MSYGPSQYDSTQSTNQNPKAQIVIGQFGAEPSTATAAYGKARDAAASNTPATSAASANAQMTLTPAQNAYGNLLGMIEQVNNAVGGSTDRGALSKLVDKLVSAYSALMGAPGVSNQDPAQMATIKANYEKTKNKAEIILQGGSTDTTTKPDVTPPVASSAKPEKPVGSTVTSSSNNSPLATSTPSKGGKGAHPNAAASTTPVNDPTLIDPTTLTAAQRVLGVANTSYSANGGMQQAAPAASAVEMSKAGLDVLVTKTPGQPDTLQSTHPGVVINTGINTSYNGGSSAPGAPGIIETSPATAAPKPAEPAVVNKTFTVGGVQIDAAAPTVDVTAQVNAALNPPAPTASAAPTPPPTPAPAGGTYIVGGNVIDPNVAAIPTPPPKSTTSAPYNPTQYNYH